MKITGNMKPNLSHLDKVEKTKVDEVKPQKDPSITETANTEQTSPSLSVELSDSATQINKVKETVASELNSVDAAKVEKFQKLIDKGEYKVDSQAVADRMIDEYTKIPN